MRIRVGTLRFAHPCILFLPLETRPGGMAWREIVPTLRLRACDVDQPRRAAVRLLKLNGSPRPSSA